MGQGKRRCCSNGAINRDKTKLIYDTIDQSGGFYLGFADPASRSLMNITFRIQSEELENQFVKESEKQGFVGLKGHRSVGVFVLRHIMQFL